MNNTTNTLSSEQVLFEDALNACDTAKIKKLISCGFYVNQILEDLPPLSLALNKGLFELVEILVSSGADVGQLDASGKFCPMFYAVKNKCPQKIIRRLILAGAPIDGIVEYNFRSTALHLAVYANQKSVIKCLISLSANVNSRDINGMTPLHIAVQANHPKIVKMLVSKGANLDAECSDKFTPLMLAIHDNNYELVTLLISLGSDVNYEPEEPKYSYQKPLNYAAGLGRVEIMCLLLKHRADAKPTTKFKETPLHSVAHSDTLTDKSVVQDTIRLLIKHGGDLNCYNNVGQNPLHSSIISKNPIVAKSLLKAGASVEKTTKNKDTPLHLAAAVGDSATVALLLRNGADTVARNRIGLTPYNLALKQKDADTVRTFWSQGQPYDDIRFESGEEIDEGIRRLIDEQKKFFHAVEFGSYNKMINALEHGAEPKGCSLLLKHPLHFSVLRRHKKIVHELLERGVPVGVLDENGETALHVACESGNIEICMDLLAHGTCYNYRSRCGKTPYQMAQANGHQGVVQILKYVELLFGFMLEIDEVIEIMANILNSSLTDRAEDYMRHLPVRASLNCVDSKGNTLLGNAFSNGFDEKAHTIMTYRLKYTIEAE